jgi:predicted RecB family nuclease
MHLTFDSVSTWLNCRLKGYFSLVEQPGDANDYESLHQELLNNYRKAAFAHLSSSLAPIVGSPRRLPLGELLKTRHPITFNHTAGDNQRSVTLDAVQRVHTVASRKKHEFIPVVFLPYAKLKKADILAAAILGTALSSWHSLPVRSVKVVHGDQFVTTRLSLLTSDGRSTTIAKQASTMLKEFETMAASLIRPPLYLNHHCGVCRYQILCRKEAVDRDDLSLLRGLQAKEIAAWNERGIFTVTQLAHTFRGKSVASGHNKLTRHSQPLQALTIRDKRTLIRTAPQLPSASTKVYLDVEGVPDEDFYYLIGILIVNGESVTSQQFWADSRVDERSAWESFMTTLSQLVDFVVFHFGRYEQKFIAAMDRRYGAKQGGTAAAPLLVDVHAAIRTNVYFPVYSNSLKDIASFLGASWAGPVRSGPDSIVWRRRWETTKDARLKDELLRYNHEDCLALMEVVKQLESLAFAWNDAGNNTTDIGGGLRTRFGTVTSALPEMKQITQCSYFTYQRDKVYFRTDKSVRRSSRRKARSSKRRPKVNEVIVASPPDRCPKCNSSRMGSFTSNRARKTVQDVKFFRGGVKRWVVRYETQRYVCRSCGHLCYSPQYPTGAPLFGRDLASWAVFQHVALQQAFAVVAQAINDLFGYGLSDNVARRGQSHLAQIYQAAENGLMARLCSTNMICIDEAQIRLKRRLSGYVWVFSGPEIVVYRFSRSRDGSLVNDALKGFSGVAVTDFYGAYDSLLCSQQKCLIHLMRDINDDLLKNPFDPELKEVAARFTALMVPIIECIDRFGLKKRHLGKFAKSADRYRKWLEGECFASKIAQRYQTRVARFGERLFTFLSHDGVPWNNNLAENAVKLIASRRKILQGLMSEDGIRDYLIFLSLFQTLRRKGASLLRFLLSRKVDVFEFLKEKQA